MEHNVVVRQGTEVQEKGTALETANKARQKFIQDAIAHGCKAREGHSGEYISKLGIFDDATGYFLFQLCNPSDEDANDVGVFYLSGTEHREANLGDYNANDGYEAVLTAAHREAGTCDGCGRYFGPDNLDRYSFAGKACADCLPKLREKYEYAGWCD